MLNRLSRLFSPCLELRGQTSTLGVVTALYPADPFDHAEVSFRGQTLSVTCAHPGIIVGQRVNIIEKPRGVFFATHLQPSWYLRPISELIAEGRTYQAALEYIMQGNQKYWPDVIMIDKRGDNKTFADYDLNGDGFITPDEWPFGIDSFNAYDTNGDGRISPEEFANAGQPVPEPTWPLEKTVDDPTNDTKAFSDYDLNSDGFITPEEWPYDRDTFRAWDTNSDGKISPDEWLARGNTPIVPENIPPVPPADQGSLDAGKIVVVWEYLVHFHYDLTTLYPDQQQINRSFSSSLTFSWSPYAFETSAPEFYDGTPPALLQVVTPGSPADGQRKTINRAIVTPPAETDPFVFDFSLTGRAFSQWYYFPEDVIHWEIGPESQVVATNTLLLPLNCYVFYGDQKHGFSWRPNAFNRSFSGYRYTEVSAKFNLRLER